MYSGVSWSGLAKYSRPRPQLMCLIAVESLALLARRYAHGQIRELKGSRKMPMLSPSEALT